MLSKRCGIRPPGGRIADWLIHREMGCDWLVANMKRFEKIRIYFNGIFNAYNMHIVI